jgi:hypothetical protein
MEPPAWVPENGEAEGLHYNQNLRDFGFNMPLALSDLSQIQNSHKLVKGIMIHSGTSSEVTPNAALRASSINAHSQWEDDIKKSRGMRQRSRDIKVAT